MTQPQATNRSCSYSLRATCPEGKILYRSSPVYVGVPPRSITFPCSYIGAASCIRDISTILEGTGC